MEPKLTADDIGRGGAASGPMWPRAADAETAALYQAHAAGLIRLAGAGQRPDGKQDRAAVRVRGSPVLQRPDSAQLRRAVRGRPGYPGNGCYLRPLRINNAGSELLTTRFQGFETTLLPWLDATARDP
jgi:hypothetical protein